jgi:hypothetical protein
VNSRRGQHGAVLLATVLAAVLAPASLAACSSSASSTGATVPSLGGSGGAGQGGGGSSSPARASALHAAAQCIRQHGIPSYSDPVLTPTGAVYSDLRGFQDASQTVLAAVQQACGTLMGQASLSPETEPPAPPQLVQAGVRAAECFRAHGLPSVKDPTARTPYTPGHGFSLDSSEVPAGGKASPNFQQAIHACQAQDTAELKASTLASLGNDS